MKIYVQDHGVYGMIVVTAETLSEAVEKMQNHLNFNAMRKIQEFDLNGFEYSNLGDM